MVARAQGGDREAMDILLRRHAPRIYAVCRRLAGNDADAADASQEALIAIVRGLPRFDGRARFTTWAHRVATNACLDELRRRGRRPTTGLGDDDEVLRTAEGSEIRLEDAVTSRLQLDEALSLLPDEFRIPVVLRDVMGCDYAEIAEILSIPAGTVRSRIARGRRRLTDLVSVDGNQDTPTQRPNNTG